MTNSNEPPRRPARRQPTRRSTTPRTSVPSARDELERERELYSQHDPTASFMHERVQNKPAGQERGASSAFPAYAGAGNDHIAIRALPRTSLPKQTRGTRPMATCPTCRPGISALPQAQASACRGSRASAPTCRAASACRALKVSAPPRLNASSAPFVAVPQLRNPARACASRQHSRSKASLRSRYP